MDQLFIPVIEEPIEVDTRYRLHILTKEDIFNLRIPAPTLSAAKRIAKETLKDKHGLIVNLRDIKTGHFVVKDGKEVWER